MKRDYSYSGLLKSGGFNTVELVVVGLLLAVAGFLSGFLNDVLIDYYQSRQLTDALHDSFYGIGWPNIREQLGGLIGVPILGTLGSKWLKAGFPGQVIGMWLGASGIGEVIVISVEYLIDILVS